MQSLRPEDRTKAVVLTCLVVAVFGLVGWRTVSAAGGSPPAAGTPTTVAMDGVQPKDGGGSDKSSPKTPEKVAPIQVSLVTPRNDPFQKVSAPKVSQNNVHTAAVSIDPSGNVPFQPLKGDILPNPSAGGDASTTGVMPIQAESLSVQGVVTGGKGVAILKLGGQSVIVKGGDTFADGYQLISVTDSQVVVKRGLKFITLPVRWG